MSRTSGHPTAIVTTPRSSSSVKPEQLLINPTLPVSLGTAESGKRSRRHRSSTDPIAGPASLGSPCPTLIIRRQQPNADVSPLHN